MKYLSAVGVALCLAFLWTNSQSGVGESSSRSPSRNLYKNWGLINSEAPSHIDAPEAWKVEEGSPTVVVAVVDTGIDPNHPDLSGNIWFESARTDSPVFGWDFVLDRPNPMDSNGHGTHVAGIIGAKSDPGAGVSGVSHHVSLMAVRYYSDSNPGAVNLGNTIRGIRYAVSHGARIINYSGGGPEFSEDEYVAIKQAEASGVLFVAAAGNEHKNSDLSENRYYPAGYCLPNIISVAATDIHNHLLSSSNWGKNSVDVAAPGENIYSTLPGGRYGYMSGTSQATAFVSGLAALILSKNPKLSPSQVKSVIMKTVDQLPNLEDKIASGGKINAKRAMDVVQSEMGSKQRDLK